MWATLSHPVAGMAVQEPSGAAGVKQRIKAERDFVIEGLVD
jgi:hypothetical protein